MADGPSGWAPVNPGSLPIHTLYSSGKALEETKKLLGTHLQHVEPHLQKKVLQRMEDLDLPSFCVNWLPGGDLTSIVALAALAASGWIADDLFDSPCPSPKEAMAQKVVASAWFELPGAVRMLYRTAVSTEQERPVFKALLEQTRQTYSHKKLPPLLRAHHDLLAYSLVSMRLLCHHENQFTYFSKEMKLWMINNVEKQTSTSDEKTATLDKLLDFREVDGGFKFVLCFCLAAGGVVVKEETFERPEVKALVRSSGLHLALLNDIFSYEKDMKEADSSLNLVEYLRNEHSESGDIDDALELAVRQVNKQIFDINRLSLSKCYQDDESKAVADCCVRQIVGNVHWSLQNKRYCFRDFVSSRCSHTALDAMSRKEN